MPFIPELFSAPVLAHLQERRRAPTGVPFFDGLMTGEIDALIGSFAGEPEVHHPTRGRVKGASAFARFVTDTATWMTERNVTVEEVNFIVTAPCGVEEFVLHVDGDAGRTELPIALAADLDRTARMIELRIYFSRWPLTGVPQVRPPLLQPDPDLQVPDIAGAYLRALAAGDVDAAVATFEPDGSVSELVGRPRTHRGTREVRAFHEQLFSDGGGIPLEHCALADDGHACALEHNVPARDAELPPEAGIAVYVRGDSGKLAAARIYAHRPAGEQHSAGAP